MKKIRKYLWSLLLISILGSCSYEFPEAEELGKEDLGEIKPERIMVCGDDYLSGLMDGALYNLAQKNSIASIVVSQISRVEEVPFIQANINSENGFNLYTSNNSEIFGKCIYQFQNQTDEKPKLVLLPGEEVQGYKGDKDLLNDVTVPSLAVGEITNADFESNLFLSRVFHENNPNLVEQIIQKSPSLVFCWLGMNDFLKYGVKGATQPESLTSLDVFRKNFEELVNGLLYNTDAKIVLGNLISFQDLPFFYIRPYNSLFLSDKLNEAFARYADFNKAVSVHNRNAPPEQQRPYIDFYDNGSSLHPQQFVVIDGTLPDAQYPDGEPLEKYRQISKEELVFYSITDEMIENGVGVVIPIDEDNYLTEKEIEFIESRVNSFNTIIHELAASQTERIAVVDLNYEVKRIAETGKTDAWGEPISGEIIYFNGLPVEGSLDLNGIFSLDGLHFNQRGNAFVANLFIDAINKDFSATIPTVDINNFVGNTYSD
jgi:lysophospholipase L1-like esterase